MNRDTQDLIKILAQAQQPEKPVAFHWAIAGLSIISLSVTYMLLGQLRPGLLEGSVPTGFFIKTTLLLGFAFIGMILIRESAKPLPAKTRSPALWIFPVTLAALMFLEWARAGSVQDIINLFYLPNFRACLFFISVYGIIGTLFLTILMRQYAPADENRAGMLIGYAAATSCALGYSFHCPIDSPTFIATAYGLPVLALTLVARFMVPKFIRW